MTVLLKRGREEDRQVETLAMANCLMLLSRINNNNNGENAAFSGRVFRCKTCDRQFQSFQALGGHRASHKKPKLLATDLFPSSPTSPAKPKTHECSICGLDFSIGQALGGHMRRHRGATTRGEKSVPVIKKSNSKRVLCLDLDLNLTPYENDLKLGNQALPVLQLGF